MIIEELYDALIEAGASADKARSASRAVADFEKTIGDIKSTIKLHSWILSFNTALLVAVLFKVFSK
jgi:hypothetical protein